MTYDEWINQLVAWASSKSQLDELKPSIISELASLLAYYEKNLVTDKDWISTKTALPELHQDVLVFIKDGEVIGIGNRTLMMSSAHGNIPMWWINTLGYTDMPDYWMPFPKKPKE